MRLKITISVIHPAAIDFDILLQQIEQVGSLFPAMEDSSYGKLDQNEQNL
jgi:hypothetical protein